MFHFPGFHFGYTFSGQISEALVAASSFRLRLQSHSGRPAPAPTAAGQLRPKLPAELVPVARRKKRGGDVAGGGGGFKKGWLGGPNSDTSDATANPRSCEQQTTAVS